MHINDYLSRKTQRKVKEHSIDTITFAEFLFGFTGYIVDSSMPDPVLLSKLNLLRQVAEDTDHYSWSGVLDWALTMVDKVNDRSISWQSDKEIAMDRLVISRSVDKAINVVTIPCPEYNNATCTHKTGHVVYHMWYIT